MAGENVGKAIVEIRADGSHLGKDIKEALDKESGTHIIKLVADIDLTKVKADLDKFKEGNKLSLKADIDLTKVRADLAALKAEQEANAIKLHADVDSSKARESLKQLTDDTSSDPVKVHAEVDANNLAEDLHRAVEAAQTGTNMRPALRPRVDSNEVEKSLKEIPEGKRILNILPKIPDEVMKGVRGLGYSLIGAIPLATYTEAISELAANFEKTAFKAGQLSAKFGTIAAMAADAGGGVLSLSADLGHLVGLTALAPVALTAMDSSMFILKQSFTGFGKALSGSAQALAKFPPDVQKIIVQLRQLNKDFSQPIKSAFWSDFGPTLVKVAKSDVPILRDAMTGLAKQLGNIFDGVLNQLHQFAQSGNLSQTFANITAGFGGLAKAAGPFTEALNTLQLAGSRWLPGLGISISNAAQRFDDFIQKADKVGNINMWIADGMKTFSQLWGVLKQGVDIVETLSETAQKAGIGGLGMLLKGLTGVRNVIDSPAFKGGFTIFLQEVSAGAANVMGGLKDLGTVLGNDARQIGDVIRLAGSLGGEVISSVSKAFDHTRLLSGMQTFLGDAREAAKNMAPAFSDLGNAIGDIATVSGPMIQATTDGIAHMIGTVSKVIAGLRDGFAASIPVFNNFTQGVIAAMSGPVIAAAKVVGDLLQAFANLPPVVQNVIMTLGLLAFALPKLFNFIKNVKQGASDMKDAFNSGWSRDVAEAMARPFIGEGPIPKNAFDTIKNMLKPVLADMGASWSLMGEAAKNIASKIGQAFKGAFQDIGTGVAMLGESIKNSLSRNWQAVVDKTKEMGQSIGNLAQKFGSLFDKPIEYAKGKLADLGNGISKISSIVANVAKDAAKALGSDIVGAVGKLGDVLKKAGEGLAAPFVAGYKGLVDFAQKAVSGFTSGSSALLQKAIGGLKSFGESAASFVSDTFNAAVGSVRDFTTKALAPVGEFFGKVGSIASGIGSVFGAVGSIIGQKISEGVKGAISGIAGQFAEIGRILATQSPAIQGIIKGFDNMKAAASRFGDYLSTQGSKAWEGLKSGADLAVTAVGVKMLEMGDGIKNQMEKAKGAFATFKDAVGQTMQSAAQRFQPIATAVQNFKESVGQMVGTTSEGFKQIGKAAVTSIGSGLKAAGASLLDAVGGPWGIAIGLATAALTAWSQAQQEAVQHAQDLAKTLDQTSGQITNATKKMIANQSLDGITNQWDDFWRGFVDRSGSVEESLGKMKVSLKDYNDTLSDSHSREDYINSLKAVRDAMFAGTPVTEEMAAALHTTKENLSQLNTGDLDHMIKKTSDLDDAMKKAEAQVKAVADSTNTSSVQAAILQKNFDTLNNTTSTASDKFTALRDNLNLLNEAQDKTSKTTKNAQRDYAQSNLDLAKSLETIKAANGDTVANLYDVAKGFDYTKQTGIDFSKTMESSRDAILKLGADALQKAQQNGKTGVDAQKAALDAMSPAIGSLENSLKAIGLSQPQIEGIIKEMGLVPDKLTTAIGVTGGDKARDEIIRTQLAAQAFATGNYSAVLAALPQSAKDAIEHVTGLAGAFKDGNYTAILAALDQTAGGRSAALANILSVTNGDYETPLKAMDSTLPGVDGAKTTIGSLTNANWVALLKAAHDPSGDGAIESALQYLTRDRYVQIHVSQIGAGTNASKDLADAQNGVDAPQSALGSILSGSAQGMYGFNPRYFANGGIENHIAQIAKPGVVPRIWAEAETGGEAYIPLGLDKRARSLKILEQVAQIFGMSLMKKMSFADGGILRTAPTALDTYRTGQSQPKATTPSTVQAAPGINLNVYPSQGLSEEQIGESAAKTLYWNMMTLPR